MKLRRICESLKPSVRTAGTSAASSKCSSTPGWAGRRVTTARSVANSSGTSTSDSRTIVAAGGELGEVEVVVDEVERLDHRAVDERDVLAHPVAEVVLVVAQDRLGHPAHRVERGAQLVRERGQEAGVRLRAPAQLGRLDLELGVQRGHRAVRVAELGVEMGELLLALAQRRERREELEVLLAQLVEDPRPASAGVMARQRREDELELVDARAPTRRGPRRR